MGNDCTSGVSNYADRYNVQHCELVGLADLDTAEEYPRKAISAYINDLLSLGVDGFRIDGAREAVQPTEYTSNGDVQEFRYAYDLKRTFNNEKLANLKNYGEGWGYMRSSIAAVFVDNLTTSS